MAARVVIFIDESNVYRDARRCFFSDDHPSTFGRIRPYRYGMLLTERLPLGASDERELKQVRVYGGMPSRHKDPQSYAAHRRQVAAWKKAGAFPIMRSLRYPDNWPKSNPEQKGVDVQLALDVVVMGLHHEYDVAIIASTDTDLRPAIEGFHVLSLAENRRIEVAAWRRGTFAKKITVPNIHVWCHFLEEDDYETVRDRRDYNIPT